MQGQAGAPTADTAGSFVPIAICGYGYRLPGGLEDDKAVWDLLAERGYVQEVIGMRYGKREVPWDGFTQDAPRAASPYEGLITDGRELEFDCSLFGMSMNDAKRMDPQIKMMLAVTWEALQCAGMDQAALHNSDTGVFIGHQASSAAGWRPPMGALSGDVPGKSGSMIANRISYHFNWMGPSFSAATACSSGITALDSAVKSLRLGECSVAAFGAVHYLGHLQSSLGFNALGIISKTGTSRSFDKDANGYMRSEGAFVYILKRLADAEQDGDKIFGVIRGCALNTAGAEADADLLTQGRMILAPVGDAQAALMRHVVEQAGVTPTDIDYVEAHATGTTVGDSTEGNAIGSVYGSPTRESPLRLASSRSNLGHMESSSFTCSLLKVLLMLQKRQFLPISSHFKEPNPNIPFEAKHMVVQTTVEDFPEHDVMVGINSFGFGGANGHCIVQEYRPEIETWSSLPGELEGKTYMVPLSAKSDEALIENARNLADQLSDLENVVDAYTLIANLSVRMTHHRVRKSFEAKALSELREQLLAFIELADQDGYDAAGVARIQTQARDHSPTIAMVFPGQGSQWAGCGKELYETEVVFRRVVDVIDAEWVKMSGGKLSDVAFDSDAGDILNECHWAQPVTFLVQAGLFEMLKAHGIHPSVVVGHSAGEAAAAYACGAYTLEEACHLVYNRSQLQQKLAGSGRMLVLMQEVEAVKENLVRLGFSCGVNEGNHDNAVEIACLNSPNNTVVCGTEEVIGNVQSQLKADGQPGGKLIPGNIAFHSSHAEPIHEDLLKALGPLDKSECRTGDIPMISTVTGTLVKNLDSKYWWENVRKTVDLLGAMSTIQKRVDPDVLVEVSPHITLRSPIRDCYTTDGGSMPSYVFSLVRGADTAVSFARTLGSCFEAGMPIDFRGVYPLPKPMTHLLPPYAMKRERVIDDLFDDCALLREEYHSAGPLLGRHKQGPTLEFQGTLSKKSLSWMADHIVQGQSIVPAAAYVECLLEAFPGEPIHIVKARVLAPFVLADKPRHFHTHINPYSYAPNRFEFTITSRLHSNLNSESLVHCVGIVEKLNSEKLKVAIPPTARWSLDDAESELKGFDLLYADSESFYSAMLARVGESFSYGPYFRSIQKIFHNPKTKVLNVEIAIDPDLWAKWDRMGWMFHPAMLDGALQLYIVYVMEACDFSGVPQMMDDFVMICKPSSPRIFCVYEPPEYLKQQHEKGQLSFGLGERPAGTIYVYDGETRELIAYLGRYSGFGANNKKSDMSRVKHFLSWQPKDDCNAETVAALATDGLIRGDGIEETVDLLIKDLMSKGHPRVGTPFFANVSECIVGVPPLKTSMESCIGTLSNAPVQYTLLSSDTEYLVAKYQEVGARNQDAHLRFFKNEALTDSGFLRPAMFELMVVRVSRAEDDSSRTPEEELSCLSKLVAPGGLVLLELTDSTMDVPADWTCIWMTPEAEAAESLAADAVAMTDESDESSARDTDEPTAKVTTVMLLQAGSQSLEKSCGLRVESDAETEIVVSDPLGFAKFWRAHIRGSATSRDNEGLVDFSRAPSWERVDYFAMQVPEDETIADPDLAVGPVRLTEWVKQFASHRAEAKDLTPCIFTVFTSGAVLDVTSPSQTGIWGAVRAMAAELVECKVDFRLVDVASRDDLRLIHGIEVMRERELCVHHGRVWTSRLMNNREAQPLVELRGDDKASFRLETNNSGVLADLEFHAHPPPKLGPTDVEIVVKASALNFRDIMVSLGKLPLLSYERSMLGRTVGMECSGQVVRCGSAVDKFRVGDKVMAMQGGCIANLLTCDYRAVSVKPENLSYEEGASTLSVYATAYYALCYLARMRKGQTILVHSALGGVGQAAIALAKIYGVHVYGTAGSEAKRAKLVELGCIGAFDSHSTDWYQDLMKATGWKGVDIVLNSLAGVHIDLCLEALAAGGWHCEIGKVDIFADRPMKLAVFRKNLRYAAIDIDRLMLDDPELVTVLTDACLDLLKAEKVPALPYTTFGYDEYQSALSYMMNGRHQGKIVLKPPEGDATVTAVDGRPIFGVGRDGQPRTVMLTGCFGGFGLRILAYVVALGAKNILMLDRDSTRSRSAEWLLQQSGVDFLLEQESQDLRIEIVHADVSKYDDVVNAVGAVSRLGLPPLGSVFHLAGVLDDKLIGEIDAESFAKVYRPKANGAWNLHRATEDCREIDHFVMLSSTSSVFGNPGQTNYSAANSYQDGLAALRQQSGKPAVSFCMTAVAETGMAARDPKLLHLMKAKGMPPISTIFAIEALDSILRRGSPPTAVAALVTDLDTDVESCDFLRTVGQLTRNSSAFKLGGGGAMSMEEIIDLVASRVASLCGVEEVDPVEPFSSYGLNSISVAELIVFLKQEMSFTISPMELMTSATCQSIAEGVLSADEDKDDEEAAADADEDEDAKVNGGTEETEPEELVISTGPVEGVSRFAPSYEEYFARSPATPLRKPVRPRHKNSSSRDHLKQDASKSPAKSSGSNAALGDVISSLPPDCKIALEELTVYVRSLGEATIDPETAVEEIRQVVVTGATGFVGRHFIADLLNLSEKRIDTVFCPVRAESDEEALERVVGAMEDAGVWSEAFREHIHAFRADLLHDDFGVSPEMYEVLAQKVDGVYHFASDLNLSAPFSQMRVRNCRFFRAAAKLCLSARKKHLFLSSTLGIFPQYVCGFKRDMGDKVVPQDAMPDVSMMKRLFPLNLSGYQWSKLVLEIVALQMAESKGVPLALFRLPEMATNSTHGYTALDDPHVQLSFSGLQTGMFPAGSASQPIMQEDGKLANEIMLRISLNPSRKHTIYHCSRPSPFVATELSFFDKMGFSVKPTTYAEFKSACQKLGEDSPLRYSWALIDFYKQYWFSDDQPVSGLINDATVREDCVPLPDPTPTMTLFSNSIEWIMRHPSSLPFELSSIRASVELESIIRPVQALCKKYALDFESVVPPFVLEGLRRVVDEAPAKVAVTTHPAIVYNLISKLESRVHLHQLLEMHPEIRDEPIEQPVFILGLNRTGTTFMHRMMEASGCFDVPHLEEQFFLLAAEKLENRDMAEEQERVAFLESALLDVSREFEGSHEMAMGVAEEDLCAHSHAFASLEYDVAYGLPEYRSWLDDQTLDEVYAEHRQWMQFISWSRRRANVKTVGRWCLKMPWHARSLPALMRTYPDAILVHTHRDPVQVAGSWCGLVEKQRSRNSVELDRTDLGKEQTESLEHTLQSAMEFRSEHTEFTDRWLDLQFMDIVTSPVASAEQVLSHAGIAVADQATCDISEYVEEVNRKRENVTLHKYHIGDYGLEASAFESGTFLKYKTEWLSPS